MTPDSDGLFWGHQVSESGTVYGSTNAAMVVPVPLALKSVVVAQNSADVHLLAEHSK